MKKILLAISMMLSLMACVKEVITLPSETVDADGEVVLSISAVVPEAQIATKGTFAAPTITSLNVLMFDDKGFLVKNAIAYDRNAEESAIVKGTATKLTNAAANSTEVEFKVLLPKTGNSCTLHFVANADVSTVEYGMETDVITSLATAGTKDAYWQKVNLPRLIDEGDLTAKCPVQLIRNHAKVTLVSTVAKFKPTGYALINYPTSGTVAPYNTTTGKFQVYNNGNVGKNFEDLVTDNYSAFMPADCDFSGVTTDNIDWTSLTVDNDLKVSGAPLYTYESVYGNTFLLVKGIFDYNNDGEFKESESFYKIDFYDPSLGNCDILRNINYQFSITNVIGPGYDAAAGAADPNVPAGNNISNSLLTQSLVNISDGTQRLSVEYTTRYLTSAAPFTLKYMFEPNIKATTTTTNNKRPANVGTPTDTNPIVITDEVADDYDSMPITWTVSDEANTSGYSTINITPQDFPEPGEIFKKRITIKSTYDGVTMSRVVDLFFINPYLLEVACDPKQVSARAGQEVTVNTIIPGGLPSAVFPLVFEIEAEAMSLYPNTAKSGVTDDSKIMPVVSGASIIPGKTKNTFHYERTLTLAEYVAFGGTPDNTNNNTVSVYSYFKTNTEANASAVYVSNYYFNQDKDFFVNQSSLIDEGFYGAYNTVQLIYTTTGPKTFTATGAHFSNGTDTMNGTATTETPFVQTLTTIDWNTVVKVNDGASDIPGKARTKLRMTATSISLNNEPLTGNRALGVYATVDAAKSMKNSIGETTTSDLRAGKAILNKSGLEETTDLYFSYTDGTYVYVANATAKALYDGATLTFAQHGLPLEMSATLEGEQYYGAGKTVTLNLTTNKPGEYTVTFTEEGASPSSTIATITVNAGSTSGSTTYTTLTWSGKVTASVKYDDADGTNPVTVDGRTRNVLVLGKMTASSNVPADNKDVEIRNASNNSTYTTVKWSELKAGGVEVTIPGLANMKSNAICFTYTSDRTMTNWFGTTYTTTPLIASDAMSGTTLKFN